MKGVLQEMALHLEQTGRWHVTEELPCKWKRIDFNQRDQALLRTLLEQKFMTIKQIKDYFFSAKEPYAYMRLWKLRRFGFVRRIWVGFVPEGLYLPTKQAHHYFENQFVELPQALEWPDQRTISHDLLVTDVRFLFQEIGFGSSWTSERTYRMGKSIRLWAPDAVIKIAGTPFAVEVECVQKMNERYEDIFSRYQQDPQLVGCLYVITTESLRTTLLKHAYDSPRIYFTTSRELFEKREDAVFESAQGKKLSVKLNLERNFKETENGSHTALHQN